MKPTRWKSPVKEEKVIPKLSSEKTLKIEFGGRMHQFQWGYVSSDLMDELVELSEEFHDFDFPDNISGIEDLIASSWFGVSDDLGTYLKDLKLDFPIIASWHDKDWGEIWEDFNIFRTLPVIDNDNALRITLEGEVLFQGTVGQLEVFKDNIYDNSEVLVFEEADEDEAKQMIQFLKNIKLTNQYKLKIKKSGFGLDGVGKSKDGWLLSSYEIHDSHYKEILEKTDIENRFSATVYGKYILSGTQKVIDFGMDKIIWYQDCDLDEFGPSGDESYCLSRIFYADTGEIALKTDDFNIMDVSVDFSWPTKIEDKLKAAQDPECPAEVLDKIASDEDLPWGSKEAEILMDAIAANPNSPSKTLINLYNFSANDNQKILILKNPNCPKDLLPDGFRFAWDYALKEDKTKAKSGKEACAKLLGHPDFPSIRNDIFENTDIYEWFLEKGYEKYLKPIAENKNCPEEILEKILDKFDINSDIGKLVSNIILNRRNAG